MLKVHSVDRRDRRLTPADAAELAGRLRSGELVESVLGSEETGRRLAEELLDLERSWFDRSLSHWAQILVAPGRAVFNWGTDAGGGAEPVDLAGYPLLASVAADALLLSDALREPGEEPLLSLVPALRKQSTFPRFYHRDSHSSVQELTDDRNVPSTYRLIWDVGLENSCDVLNVNLVPRRALSADDGSVRPEYRHLFQRQNLSFRTMSSEEIDAIQPQVREETLPFRETRRDLVPGHAFLWLDDLFFHATYQRAGRDLRELQERPRSILLVREFRDNRQFEIDFTPRVRELLALPPRGSEE